MIRDTLMNETYFVEYIENHDNLMRQIQAGIESSVDDDARKRRFVLAKGVNEYNQIKAAYSSGRPLDEVKKHLLEFIDVMPEFWGGTSSILYMYDAMALSILLDVEIDRFTVLADIVHATGREDALTIFFEKYYMEENILLSGKSAYGNPYDKLISIVLESGNREDDLVNFLKNDWYSGHSEAFWYNTHKGKNKSYAGYWSFVVAAFVKIYHIDDSRMRNVQYYPYDLVHHQL